MEINNLEQAISLLQANHAELPYDVISTIFDRNNLDSDGEPKIITNKLTVIILDNKNWNNTYLIDLVLKNHDPKNNIQYIYVDDAKYRNTIINNDTPIPSDYYNNDGTLNCELLEHDYIFPSLIGVIPNGKTNGKENIVILSETKISVINEDDVKEFFEYLTK